MNIQNGHQDKPHSLHIFDSDIERLNALKLQMAELIAFQLDQAMLALDQGDIELAQQVISRDEGVNQFEINIDAEVLYLLARHSPVANDLRTVISTSKIAVELEKMGDEIVEFAKLILVLYNPNTSDPNSHLLEDVFKISFLIKNMIGEMLTMLNSNSIESAYALLAEDRDCENNLEAGIKHQLSSVILDGRLIGRTLDILQMMKSLERCGEYCRNISRYILLMLDAPNKQHTNPHENANAC
jgi:phosphate transport system protein